MLAFTQLKREPMLKLEQMQFFITTCDRHAMRLKMTISHVSPLCPLTGSAFTSLQDAQMSFIEFMTSRFTKLLDTIGGKIFPTLIDLLEPNSDRQSFLDTLHKLEKWNFLPSAERWICLKAIRNDLTHDYPDQQELMAKHINRAVEASQELLECWIFLKEKTENLRELS